MGRTELKRPEKAEAFAQRMNRVIDYIDTHLAEVEPLRLEAVAAVAAFSPFHFHRIFRAWTGETLQDFIRQRRLEKAAGQLVHNPSMTVQSISQHSGFGSSEAFARAFSQHFGMSPSNWRAGGYRQWDPVAGKRAGEREEDGLDVRIRVEPVRTVAYFRVGGDYRTTSLEAWTLCLDWMDRHGLNDQPCFGMALDDPRITPPDRCRYDACVELPAGWAVRGERISRKVMVGGLYASLLYVGPRSGIGDAWLKMLDEWLPNSGRGLGEAAFFEHYQRGALQNTDPVTVELFMPLGD